jgi:hypothetical protein
MRIDYWNVKLLEEHSLEGRSNILEINRGKFRLHPCYSKASRDEFEFDKLVDWSLENGVVKSEVFVARYNDDGLYVIGGAQAAEAYFVGFPYGSIKVTELYDMDEQVSKIYKSGKEEFKLCPIEEGMLLKGIKKGFKLTDGKLGVMIGLSRQTVNHSIKLINLCKEARTLVSAGYISKQSAKYLLSAPKYAQGGYALKAFKNSWSSRRLYQEINKDFVPKAERDLSPKSIKKIPDLIKFEENITNLLGLVTNFNPTNISNTEGELTIKFHSYGEFTRLLELISTSQDSKSDIQGELQLKNLDMVSLDFLLENILPRAGF